MSTVPETSRCGQEPLEFSMLDYLAELPEDWSSRMCGCERHIDAPFRVLQKSFSGV